MLVLRPLRSKRIRNGAVVSPRPEFESHFGSVLYLVSSLCELGRLTIQICFPHSIRQCPLACGVRVVYTCITWHVVNGQ